jgi:serine/threonine protein kinase
MKIGDRIPSPIDGSFFTIVAVRGGREEIGVTHSGMGIVYLVYDEITHFAFAVKTFQDQFVSSATFRDAFRREAATWVRLGLHKYIVHCYGVYEIHHQPYIWLECILPDTQGRNSLDHYLMGEPMSNDQILRWAIEFCDGMEYAHSRGLVCHGDIKPANIMITEEMNVAITDFGLARAIEDGVSMLALDTDVAQDSPRLSLMRNAVGRVICGTPGYIAPELLDGAQASAVSDIFAFGIVLLQLKTGANLPLHPSVIHRIVSTGVSGKDRAFWNILSRSCDTDPVRRYQHFAELREDLERLVSKGAVEIGASGTQNEPAFADWYNMKGYSFLVAEQFESALEMFDRAIELNPQHINSLNNRSVALRRLGRCAEALVCIDKALEIHPNNAQAWANKGNVLGDLGDMQNELVCIDRALEISPEEPRLWHNKAALLHNLHREEEALQYLDRFLQVDENSSTAWTTKAAIHNSLRQFDLALKAANRAAALNPLDPEPWIKQAVAYYQEGLYDQAAKCFTFAVEVRPNDIKALLGQARSFENIGNVEAARDAFDRLLMITPSHQDQVIKWAREGLNRLNSGAPKQIDK